VTIEANPDDVNVPVVKRWMEIGINRVSLGVQSLQPTTLDWMHRTHSPLDALRALDILIDSGMESVSVDVIFGLPTEAGADPVGDVARLVERGPSHLSAYGLTIESGTPLAKRRARGRTVAADESRFVEEFNGVRRVLKESGYDHYEVSNYARSGCHSVHNQGYWNGASYLGIGPSAHSFAGDARWWNVRDWAAYDGLMSGGMDPIADRERLDSRDRWLETVYLGLRTSRGLDEALARFLPVDTLDRLISADLLRIHDGRVTATADGWLRLDEIVARLTTSSEGG
jgi:oxygen-independent coproporphyrinogen-3 oxidase